MFGREITQDMKESVINRVCSFDDIVTMMGKYPFNTVNRGKTTRMVTRRDLMGSTAIPLQ